MEAWVRYFGAAGYEVVAPSLPGHGPSDTRILARTEFADYVEACAPDPGALRPPTGRDRALDGRADRPASCGNNGLRGLVLVASVPPFALTARLNAMRHFPPVVLPHPPRPPIPAEHRRPHRSHPPRRSRWPSGRSSSPISAPSRVWPSAPWSFGRARVEPEDRRDLPGPLGQRQCGPADPAGVYRRLARHLRADEIDHPRAGPLAGGDRLWSRRSPPRVRAWIEALCRPPLSERPRPSFAPRRDV